ncbi:unnamed protein product [Nyctereutes procyonoides]|uniref:(raccoon dog) hypothetical protein n=1 Tax=Nyctereutes procyonoides TaxID=34880 RepID=A0A811Y1J1_NYCPR|nr:unnamed protein product [Nyctereutes procyonoides]
MWFKTKRYTLGKLTKPVNETDTPAQLELEDEHVADVHQQQTVVSTKKRTCLFTPELCQLHVFHLVIFSLLIYSFIQFYGVNPSLP